MVFCICNKYRKINVNIRVYFNFFEKDRNSNYLVGVIVC